MIITVTCNPSYDKTLEVPDFTPGETSKARIVCRQPAGKGVNISGCIAGLGRTSIATGFIGKMQAPLFSKHLEAAGATAEFVAIDGETRTNTTILDPQLGTTTHLREQGFSVSSGEVAMLAAKLQSLTREGDLVIIAGSLPPGITAEDMSLLIRQCKSPACQTAVDSSGEALEKAVETGCTIIKPNLEEMQELTRRSLASEQQILEAARELLHRVEIVLVTMGAEGACCVTRDAAWRGRVVVENVVNTVGAGDAFLAGFAVHHSEGAPLDLCLRKAVACGAASATAPCAGELDAGKVERISNEVELAKV